MSTAIDLQQFFVFPSRAIDNSVPVNIVVMATFNKLNKQDVRNGNKMTFSIIFQKSEVAKEGQTIEWRYADQECRDADYNELKNKVSTTL